MASSTNGYSACTEAVNCRCVIRAALGVPVVPTVNEGRINKEKVQAGVAPNLRCT